MKHPLNRVFVAVAVLSTIVLGAERCAAAAGAFDWQRDYARVTETGDIVWTPKAFEFAAGGNVRYIDYENGADANDGASKERPWKHHPWDANAAGNAAAANSIDTYVFKGRVAYRGQLEVKEQGKPDKPIRLTRDPGWGRGRRLSRDPNG